MEWVIIFCYGLSLLVICLFSLGQFNLAWHYRRSKKGQPRPVKTLNTFPKVTVQLPVYNERYVVERLIDCVMDMDYPIELMEVQVLDDSTDETQELIASKVAHYQTLGYQIKHVRRPERKGFKAGALQYGLKQAQGEFVAIFDADFLPDKNFLLNTLPEFDNDKIGMVQTRWDHLNDDYSLLTKMQAFGLNAHFTVEQRGRQAAGSFINFNGTAGVWRTQCIEDAGGWQSDTLTEDLDLSYRAQLNGWQFVYLEDILSPAELPVIIPAVKSQQYRWNKGAAETARKNLGKVWSSSLDISHKIRASLHLLNSSVFLFLLIAAILSIPMLYIKDQNPALGLIFDLGSVFIIGFIAMSIFYWFSAKACQSELTFKYFITRFPMFLSYSMGMALHNAIAITEGFLGIKTPFVRTPKFNIQAKGDTWKGNVYLKSSINILSLLEGLLALYFLFGIVSGFKLEDYGLLFFHMMLFVGFGYIFIISLKPVKAA